jgi:hypothetical protein
MTINKWRLALASAGIISLGTAVQAEEQHQVMTALSQTTLSGYVDTSAIWSPGGPNGTLWGRTFDGTADKLDGFNLHAVKLVLEKPLDEGQWSAGYKADLVFGPDANYYSSLQNGGAFNSDDFAVKQAYVALRAPVGNGLDIKLGVWDTLIGYEVFESVNNPNFSRSYGYFIEPTHHTGVLLSYHVADWLSVSGGVANGWTGPVNDKIHTGASENGEDRKAFLGSLTITLPEAAGVFAGSAIYAGIVSGENTGTFGGVGSLETTSYYLGTTLATGLEGLSVGAALDYRDDGNIGLASSHAFTAALYTSFQATEKLKLNARAEYAKGTIGTWYGGFAEAPTDTTPANDNVLGALTVTADYSLWANVVTRAEVRWDKNLGGDEIYHNTGGAQNDADSDALTVTANFVYKF